MLMNSPIFLNIFGDLFSQRRKLLSLVARWFLLPVIIRHQLAKSELILLEDILLAERLISLLRFSSLYVLLLLTRNETLAKDRILFGRRNVVVILVFRHFVDFFRVSAMDAPDMNSTLSNSQLINYDFC